MNLTTSKNEQCTLYELSIQLGVKHSNFKRDFRRMLDNLSDDEVSTLNFTEAQYEQLLGNGAKRYNETVSMDYRTAMIFATKVNDSLRMKIVDYALAKYQEQQNQLVEKQQAIIDRQANHKLVTYSDGTESLRKLIKTYYPDTLKEQATWRKLVQKGIVAYEERTTHVKVLLNTKYGEQQQDSIRWNDNILDVLDELAEEK